SRGRRRLPQSRRLPSAAQGPRACPHEVHGRAHRGSSLASARGVRASRPGVRRHPLTTSRVSAELRVVELLRDRAGISRFLRVADNLYRGDACWVAPILSDRKKVLGDANPFFTHARMALWVAVRGGDVGRIAGIVDDHHNMRHNERTAFFGFFESANDPEVSDLLFATVRAWARGAAMIRMLGPMNPSINEECGLLVDGFDTRPLLMMTYNPPYYAELCQR